MLHEGLRGLRNVEVVSLPRTSPDPFHNKNHYVKCQLGAAGLDLEDVHLKSKNSFQNILKTPFICSFVKLVSAPVQNGQAGVRYITEDLIRKLTKEDNLEMVTTLNLTLSKEGGKKIKVFRFENERDSSEHWQS